MSSYKRSSQGEAFLVAFTDAVRDTEGIPAVDTHWTFHLTEQRGVICFHGDAYYTPAGATGVLKMASIEGTYPNAVAGSLEAFLYSLAFKLGGMASSWYTEERAARRI
jgi:hypothetical protein